MPTVDPDLELQGLIIRTLKADVGVKALVNGRVYDRVKQTAAFPYISFGPTDSITGMPDCIDDSVIAIQLDVWSRDVGFPEAKTVSEAVRVALHDRDDLTLAHNALVYLQHRGSRPMRDPDGLTSHVVMEFEAAVERRA